MSFFEHIAATDDSERIAKRKATVIAAQRFEGQFGAFLKGASSKEDFNARLALIDSDIKEMTYDVAEEYGGDPQVIESAVRRHFLGSAHTVEERDGEYFVVEDSGAETVAGPFQERQEAQDRASELDDLEPLEKEAASDEGENLRQGVAGLISDIESMYGEVPEAEYLSGQSPSEDLMAGLRDFVNFGYNAPNPARNIQGVISDVMSVWGETDAVTDYAIEVLNDFQAFRDQDLNDPHFGSVKLAVRRPKMCPYHSELTEASLQAGEPQYAAFSTLVGGPSHCKGSFDGKCNFKSEMVTQEYWDNKAEQAAERKRQREEQQEVVEIAEQPIDEPIEEPVAENTELTEELSEAPSAVGEFSEGVEEVSAEPMAIAANLDKKTSSVDHPGDLGNMKFVNVTFVFDYMTINVTVDVENALREHADYNFEGIVEEAREILSDQGVDPNLAYEIQIEGEPFDPSHISKVARPLDESKTANMKDRSNPPAARNHPPDPGLVGERPTRQYQPGNPVVPGDVPVAEKYPSPTRLVDSVPGGAPPQLHPEEITGAGIPLDEDPYHMLTPEEVRRIHLMREKAAKFASLKQAKDCNCWKGYKRVPGTKPCAPGSCEKCDSAKESSRRQAEVAWDGGGATKNERGNWGWNYEAPKADETGLDDQPSGPALDKTRWQPAALDPNGKGNLKPVDTEYPGTPNPTIQEVLWQRREDEDVYGQQEFGDGTNSVTEQQELPAADETGQTTEKNLDQGSQGGTFPNEGQANPVTSKVAYGEPDEEAKRELATMAAGLLMEASEYLKESGDKDLEQAAAFINSAVASIYEKYPWDFSDEDSWRPTSKVAGVPEDLTAIYDQLDGIAGGEVNELVADDLSQALALIDRAISKSEQEHQFVEVPGGNDFCERCGCDLQDAGGPCVSDEELDAQDSLVGGHDSYGDKSSKVADFSSQGDCLDSSPEDPCEGPVELRMALSGTGKPFPRCEKHWERRLQQQDEINQRYAPNSDVPPADFDPDYAGERWDDEY